MRMQVLKRLLFCAAWLPLAVQAQGLDYPTAAKRPVVDSYHGVAVTDDYRWMDALREPEVTDWVGRQNALTRKVLDAVPQRPAIHAELTELLGRAPTRRQGLKYAGGRLFALKRLPGAAQPQLVVLANPADLASERLLLDPVALNAKGTTAIDWYEPSLDGRLVAVSLSDEGSEDGTLHIFDVASGRQLPDRVPRVQYATAGGSVAWAPGNRGLYYTRYPQGQERPEADRHFYQQVWFHRLGTPASADTYVIGREFPRIAEIELSTTPDGRHVLADVSNGDGGEHAFYLRRPSGRWDRLAGFADGVRKVVLAHDGRWFALVLQGSPRGRVVVGTPSTRGVAQARTVVEQGDSAIASLALSRSRLYLERLAGGPQELHVHTQAGKPLGRLGGGGVATDAFGTALQGDAVLFGSQSFVQPFAWYLHAPSARQPWPEPVKTALNDERAVPDMPEVEVRREMATSRDGTQVPVNIVMRKGLALDGSHPLLLTAYGGYGVSMQPWYSPINVFWLRHGGIFVVANVRGGGEFGEDWHQAGMLTRKQNVFDDFIACAEHLVARGYTSRQRLAIEGGSNGGLLMGAVATQRPDLFRAVVSHVGVYDMLRVEFTPNGEFNTTEFGSVKDPAQFKALHAYSPYHRVVDGTDYPPMLLLTGLNDGRVDPAHTLKFGARLQAAARPGATVLLRVAGDAGHGQGMALGSRIESAADVHAFLFSHLGMK